MRPARILAVVGATLLGAPPAFGQAASGGHGPNPTEVPTQYPIVGQTQTGGSQSQSGATAGQSGTASQQTITDADLQKYAQALNDIAEFDADVAVVVRRGDTVEVTAVDEMTQPEVNQALQKAGLSKQEFKRITQQIHEDQQLRQRYSQMVRQTTPQSGGASGSSSGASPSASPQ